jgi:lipopolysaccharide/colanic/teichoic acid biosynthesis glycosyltransferase
VDTTQAPVAQRRRRLPIKTDHGEGQRSRVRHGIPATRDLEATLSAVLTLAGAAIALAALRPLEGSGWAAAVAAAVVLLIGAAAVLLRAVLTLSPAILRWPPGGSRRPVRVAVVGPAASAHDVGAELQRAGVEAVVVAGAIVPVPAQAESRDRLELGALRELSAIVESQHLDLVLIDPGVSRPDVIAAVFESCERSPVRLCDLSAFYEDVFGRVPVTEIDTAWCQYVLHPRFRERRSQRALDLVVACALAVISAPFLAVAALLVRQDGGPVLFRQRRVGQYGRPFVIYKLRTMRWEGSDGGARWTADHDPRVTRVGRVLRRSHLDELPQILNVMRGDMTLVGPRPEQPDIAASLEASIPFWRARYRHKPGLTGWAQIRCGYAGSLDGSAWKLAHDLYYLRHRSLVLDLAILLQTASTLLVTPRQLDKPETRFLRPACPLPGAAPPEELEAIAPEPVRIG